MKSLHFASKISCFLISLAFCLLIASYAKAHAIGNPPIFGLPYASGTANVSMGISGLHGGNFSGVPGYPYQLNGSSSVTDASLDIGWVNPPGNEAEAPAVALADGQILIGAGNSCNMILINYGNNIWGEYIHMSNIPSNLTTGAHVNTGQVIGTPTNQYVCQESGTPTFIHTHFAFLQQNDSIHATYLTMASPTVSTVLCGSNVLYNSIALGGPAGVGTVDNLQGLRSPFSIPTCPGQGTISLTTGVQVSQNQGFIGGSITASYTVTNSGSGPFNLQSLNLLAVDPNGTWVQLGHDNTTSIPANSSVVFNHTFYDLGNGDNTAKGGSWGIFAEYTDTNGHYQIPPGNGNGYYVGENDISRKVTAFNFDPYGSFPVVYYERGTDGRYYEDDEYPQPPAHWGGWTLFDPQHPQPPNVYFVGPFNVSPNLATPVPQLAAWARAADGTIWHETQDTHNVWGGWSEMPTNGAGAAGDIAITINPLGKDFEYYDVGTNGNVWHNYGNFNNYSPVSSQPTGVTFIGNVAAIVTPANNNEDLFVTDSNGGAWHDNWNPTNGWAGWSQIQPGFMVGGNIAAQLNTYNNPEIFVTGHDGSLYHSLAPFTNWSVIYQNPGGINFVGDVNAQSNLATISSINIFVMGSDGNIYQNQWAYHWIPWILWPSSPVSLTGDPFTVVNAYGNIEWEAMIKGADGDVWHNWGGWNNWTSSGATG